MDIEQILKAARKRDSRIVAIRPVDLGRLEEKKSADTETRQYRLILLDEDGTERCMTPREWEAWLAEPTDSPLVEEEDAEPEEERPETYSVNPKDILTITPVASAAPVTIEEAVDEEDDPMALAIGYHDDNEVFHPHRAKDFLEWSK